MPTPIRNMKLPVLQGKVNKDEAKTIFEKPLQQGFGIHDPEEEMIEKLVASKNKLPIRKVLAILQG